MYELMGSHYHRHGTLFQLLKKHLEVGFLEGVLWGVKMCDSACILNELVGYMCLTVCGVRLTYVDTAINSLVVCVESANGVVW
jgi:hypothetical protein